ncbi:MAG: AmmeMemoRadiSam system radical SAM enzyme, partial [Pirellulaceae bacterium]
MTLRSIGLPPETLPRPDGHFAAGWWHAVDAEGRLVCDLCPRECSLKPGDRGFCFVRQNVGGEMLLTTYGRSTGFCIDPIEKKPLNHFLPGTSILSFGTAGCNLGCKFCQNWDISKSREVERLSDLALPEAIAQAANHYRCRSVAYTYNDPVIWAEYAIDTAKACRAQGIKNVAVTAGYISPAARSPFFEFMDAANVDLKAFTEEFYFKVTYSHLQPVLETLEWLRRETPVWFEITNLVIPQANDSLDEIRSMCDWILQHVGDEVPVHFTAFHPDFRMRDRPATPPETLVAAHEVACQQGLKYVYTGNVNDVVHQSTYCGACQQLVIERNWYELGAYHLAGNRCAHCGAAVAGVFEDRPGDWGRKRLPVRIADFQAPVRDPEKGGETLVREAVASYPLPVLPSPPAKSPRRPASSSLEEPSMSSTASQASAAARLQAQRPKLNPDQQQAVFHAACEMISAAVANRREVLADATLAGVADRTVMGAFVTLKRQGRLRACCGSLGRPMPLVEALRQSAVRTALEDHRLPPISVSELPFLDVDVQLLYGFQPVAVGSERAAAVEVGRHGVQIRRGDSAGLLLPAVAREQGYTAEEFLRQVSRKAGLPATAWQEADSQVQTFEAFEIPGPFASSDDVPVAPAPWLAPAEVVTLGRHCAANLSALLRGATPSYYVPGVSDGSVQGLTLTLRATEQAPIHFFRLAMRPGLPLQSTLFHLTESAAGALRSGQLPLAGGNLGLSVSVLYDSAMHGTVEQPDLRGVDPQQRALLVAEGAKSAWVYDPRKSPDQLLARAAELARVFQPSAANLLSFAIQSTDPAVEFSNAPVGVTGSGNRPPAVAGSFYPDQPEELDRMVTDLLDMGVPRRPVAAAMVPHAGLKYSGKIAARVLEQIDIPDTVIILGPKHTRLGLEWAVAPHERWTWPGGSLPNDRALAAELVDAIAGLQFDAAAHQREHGIEVELPFLGRLAPQTKVVGIVIGAGDLNRCRQFAQGLAEVLRRH